MNNKQVVVAIEKVWGQLSYDERENVIMAKNIAKEELKAMGICNETVTETINIIALQLITLILESTVVVGDDTITTVQYRDRVCFLLNEALDNGLLQYTAPLERLYYRANGVELYTIECTIGDYIWGGESECV